MLGKRSVIIPGHGPRPLAFARLLSGNLIQIPVHVPINACGL
ncbi:chaplin family protein, partial [Kitasatospora humi]